jgi:hypothetical protein
MTSNWKVHSFWTKLGYVPKHGKDAQEEKKMKAKVWIPRLHNFQKIWSLFNREGCGISKNKHHDCAMNDNGVICFERIKEEGGSY